MHEAFVGRQPIFDVNLKVYAYELLFRAGMENSAQVSDGDRATSQVLVNTFTELGLEHIVGGRKAFINMTRDFLLDEGSLPLPKDRVVLEVLEDVTVDAELVRSVRGLAEKGYTIALDDFTYHERWQPLLEIADIVKLEVMGLDDAAVREQIRLLRPYKAKLLAEKIETEEEFESLKSQGFDYFQGYFLARPKVIKGKRAPSNRLSTLRLVAKLQDLDAEIRDIERIIGQDVGLSYKILRYINSAFFSLPRKVESIRQALVYLGLRDVKRLATLIAMASFPDRPSELVVTALFRARMCELLAEKAGNAHSDTFFTTGLLSTLDALMNMPMEEVLGQLPLTGEITGALLEHRDLLGEALRCTKAQEQADGSAIQFAGLPATTINQAYIEALTWSMDSAQALTPPGG